MSGPHRCVVREPDGDAMVECAVPAAWPVPVEATGTATLVVPASEGHVPGFAANVMVSWDNPDQVAGLSPAVDAAPIGTAVARPAAGDEHRTRLTVTAAGDVAIVQVETVMSGAGGQARVISSIPQAAWHHLAADIEALHESAAIHASGQDREREERDHERR
jgi:hypothetical protein